MKEGRDIEMILSNLKVRLDAEAKQASLERMRMQLFQKINAPRNPIKRKEKRYMENKREEVNELELEAAAGGLTENRYNPDVCGKFTKVQYECVGLLKLVNCDHYREAALVTEGRYRFTCAMGRYDYIGYSDGKII